MNEDKYLYYIVAYKKTRDKDFHDCCIYDEIEIPYYVNDGDLDRIEYEFRKRCEPENCK